jgi:hypothetical protein
VGGWNIRHNFLGEKGIRLGRQQPLIDFGQIAQAITLWTMARGSNEQDMDALYDKVWRGFDDDSSSVAPTPTNSKPQNSFHSNSDFDHNDRDYHNHTPMNGSRPCKYASFPNTCSQHPCQLRTQPPPLSHPALPQRSLHSSLHTPNLEEPGLSRHFLQAHRQMHVPTRSLFPHIKPAAATQIPLTQMRRPVLSPEIVNGLPSKVLGNFHRSLLLSKQDNQAVPPIYRLRQPPIHTAPRLIIVHMAQVLAISLRIHHVPLVPVFHPYQAVSASLS